MTPTRRRFIGGSVAGLAGLLAGPVCTSLFSCGGADNGKQNSRKPNIIVIVADDAGWADVGYHGSEIKTPNIDKLAGNGVELDRFYVYPVCSPTRAALLTGRPPSRFGILGPIAMKSELALPADTVTLAELLKRQGYHTAISGKWHLGLSPDVGPGKYGFMHTYGYLHGQIDQLTHIYKNGDRSWHRDGKFIDEEGHATDLITNEAIRFITSGRDKTKPFFLYVPYSVPHYPLQEDDRWVEPYRSTIADESRRLYAASMTHMDDAIGRLIGTVTAENLGQDTLVIFFSDNGGQESWIPTFEYDGKFTPNDRLGNNEPLRDWKGSLYEGGIRTPALVSWPGKLKPSKITEPVYVCDIFPTLARFAGAGITDDMKVEGVDIWPVITGSAESGERVFYWRTEQQLALREGDWKLVHNGGTPDDGVDELYNVTEDPYEKNDCTARNPAILGKLKTELAKQFAMD